MHIFLSYSRTDLKQAEQIAANIKQAGHEVFFDRHNIKVAEDFNRVIWGEIQKAELFIFLISPNSVRAGSYALTELGLAEKKWPNPERKVLPVIIEETALTEIPIYASICHMLKPVGNLAAEVRGEVKDLHKRQRYKKFVQAATTIVGLLVVGLLVMLGYQEYLDRAPLIARAKLAEMNITYDQETFVDRVTHGDMDAVKLFLAAGMDPNAVNARENTALMIAVDREDSEIINALIEANVDVNAKNYAGSTALIWAAGHGQETTVSSLLKAGADTDTDAVNKALISAAERGHLSVFRLLWSLVVGQSAIDNAFIAAARGGNREILVILLDKISEQSKVTSEALLNATSEFGYSHKLTVAEQIENLEYLLKLGANVNVKAEDGITPLISVTGRSIPELVKLLLEKAADPNTQCGCMKYYGGDWTPLTLIIKTNKEGKNPIVNLFLKGGADVNLTKKDGTTALMLAARDGDLHLVQKLLEKGANVNTQNEKGQTALSMAKDRRHEDVVALLLRDGAD